MTHVCVGDLTIIVSDNGFSPDRRQAIICTNARMLSIGPLRTNFSEILFETLAFSIQENAFESVVSEKVVFLSRPQCVTGYDTITACDIPLQWLRHDNQAIIESNWHRLISHRVAYDVNKWPILWLFQCIFLLNNSRIIWLCDYGFWVIILLSNKSCDICRCDLPLWVKG